MSDMEFAGEFVSFNTVPRPHDDYFDVVEEIRCLNALAESYRFELLRLNEDIGNES